MSDESSQPRDIPESRTSQESDRNLQACSQPDRSSGLNDDWFMRDHSRSVVSLSFKDLYIDGERTIILQQDVAGDKESDHIKEDTAKNPDENTRETTKNHCYVGDNHRSPVSDEEDLIIKKLPLSGLAEVPGSCTCIAYQKETKEFFAREVSDYIMIGSPGDEVNLKINKCPGICDSYCKHIDNDFSSSVCELPRDDNDQIDCVCVRNRGSLSTMNTSSASSINDTDISRQSSLNTSINSYASQSSTVTEVGSKVHHCEVTASLSRLDMCQGISQTSQIDKVKLASFKLFGTKIACYLHYLGLDQDCKPNGSLTFTAVLHLPKRKRGIWCPLDHKKCTVKLTVSTYEGPVEAKNIMNEPRFSLRELDDDDRQRLTMHMTVHDVVRQETIIFSERCPEKIFFKIRAEICAN